MFGDLFGGDENEEVVPENGALTGAGAAAAKFKALLE